MHHIGADLALRGLVNSSTFGTNESITFDRATGAITGTPYKETGMSAVTTTFRYAARLPSRRLHRQVVSDLPDERKVR
ncbi:MAG: hypothetical protein WBB91_04400 [Nostocoides sp.]|jgi:hypothetical protein|uniref:hypothetical protein n=1 Tax=Nostocoides sp. TaxID=1917966 RepID=UPI003C70EC4B